MRLRTAVIVVLLAASCSERVPAVDFPDGTPADFEALAVEVLSTVSAAAPAHSACLDGLVIEGAWGLGDRARYHLGEARIEVRIPATAPQLTASLVHEIAHHLDAECGHDDMRSAFREAQGIASGHAWHEGESWEDTPAEQFAAAVVVLVTGRPDRPPVFVSQAGLDVVERWAHGEDLTHAPSAP